MKRKHNAKTRLLHYEEAYRKVADINYHTYVCLILREINGGSDAFDLEYDYPEFYIQKPEHKFNDDSWFYSKQERLSAILNAIYLVKDKIVRNELD